MYTAYKPSLKLTCNVKLVEIKRYLIVYLIKDFRYALRTLCN